MGFRASFLCVSEVVRQRGCQRERQCMQVFVQSNKRGKGGPVRGNTRDLRRGGGDSQGRWPSHQAPSRSFWRRLKIPVFLQSPRHCLSAKTLMHVSHPSTHEKKTCAHRRHAHCICRRERGSHKDRGKEKGEEGVSERARQRGKQR